jgi:cobaltochelatase CobT
MRAQQALREASLATIKAITNRTDPPGANELLRETPAEPNARALAIWRGRVDALGLRMRLSDAALHASRSPVGPAAALFDELEQCRVEAVGMRSFVGIRDNLAALHGARPQRSDLSGALIDAARRRFERQLRMGLGDQDCELLPQTLREAVERLSELLLDQATFAEVAASLAVWVHTLSRHPAPPPLPASDDAQPSHETKSRVEAQESPTPQISSEATHASVLRSIGSEPRGRIVPASQSSMPAGAPYRAFTRQFDTVVDARSLFDASQLHALRRQFEQQASDSRKHVARWANRLQRQLLSWQRRAWHFDQDEGLLDCSRLARIVADPLQTLSFKQEIAAEFPDTAVTLLVDNSGSMRGVPIAMAATCAEMLGTVLERCGVVTEILGFTTRRWRGGRSREQWIAARCPPEPGRLTDLLHVVYKAADTPWRRARGNVAAMLSEALLKENVDGEALQWAHARLLRRPEPRRILMVISDGAPLDDATLAANDFGYLDRHLREVIAEIQRIAAVELLAIGIGHDVGHYYSHAFTVTEPEELGEAMVTQLIGLLEQSPGRAMSSNPGRGR